MAAKAADALCARGDPAAVVLLALGSMSAAVMQEMARRNKMGLLYVAMSFVSSDELYKAAPTSAWEMVSSQQSTLFFTQVVPPPSAFGSKYRIITEFQTAMRKYQPGMRTTHESLEGFIAGRLNTAAASRALELNGWPLTRATFLDAIFRDIRTFQLYGSYTLGPYGDGVGRTGAAQTTDDWCNQGAHEIFMTEFDLGWGTLWPVDTWSFKFSGCGVARWNDTSRKSLVGYVRSERDTSADVQRGLSAATRAHNSGRSTPIALMATLSTGIDAALDTLIGRNPVTIAALPRSGVNRSLDLINQGKLRIPLIAPLSGLRSLRSPFTRGVVNLFASYYQEARTAGSLLAQKHNADRIAVLWSSQTHHDAGKDFAAKGWPSVETEIKDVQEWENVYRTSVTPQIASLPSSNAVRQDFKNWVSSIDQQQEPFEGFLIGRFISTVIESMKEEGMSSGVVTAGTLLDAVYSIQYFKIDNKITVGPFLDQNRGERLCNQGMDAVYVTKWDVKQLT
eukprot:m51a1_g6293 hypothetical protein (508) ;mRNA; r:263265-265227